LTSSQIELAMHMNIKPRNSKNLKVFLALAIGVALFHISCTLLKKTHKQSYHLTTTLPGVIPIDSLLFCDETEIANIHYREYMYWTRRVYGKASDKYQSILPDTLSWIQDSLPLDTFTEIYLRHPAYYWYPVVGVTQEQARDFGQWRSDRVFEFLLIKEGVLKIDTNQNAQVHFTTEKYLAGNHKGLKPDTAFKYYPVYRLPTLQERKHILQYADSVNKKFFEDCNSKYCRECISSYPSIQSEIAVYQYIVDGNDSTKYLNYLTRPITSDCVSKKQSLYNLRGNVSEWIADSGVCVGGGWRDSTERVLATDTFHLTTHNAWTGFRNVCKWKKWEK